MSSEQQTPSGIRPSVFGGYLLLKQLALGGMAEIFLAKQFGAHGFEKLVVIKRILEQYASDPDFVAMFLDEARLAATLSHPNVVQIYDLGTVDHLFFMSMEFVAGHDVLAITRKCIELERTIPVAVALRIAADVCAGLSNAHTKRDHQGKLLNIVHRDVSPTNILVSYEGTAKLVDFGIAKAETQTAKTRAGQIKGKLAYMAPEQIAGERLDARADVYGLTVVLYEMLVGKRLFKRTNELALIKAVLEGVVPPPSKIREGLPKSIDKVVLKGLQRHPNSRFASAREMEIALEECLQAFTPVERGADRVSAFVKELFVDELLMHNRFMAALPRADDDQLAAILSTRKVARSTTGGSDPSRSEAATRVELEEHPIVQLPTRRRWLWPVAGVALVLGISSAALGLISGRAVTGSIRFESAPAGARVKIAKVGEGWTTPVVIPLELGEYEIELTHPGYAPTVLKSSLSIERPNDTFRVELQAVPSVAGPLRIETTPPGGAIQIDGVLQSAPAPLLATGLSPGEHLVEATLDGYHSKTQSVLLAAGEPSAVTLVLEAKEAPAVTEGEVSVRILTSLPAVVSVGGRKLGESPVTAQLPMGPVKLRFQVSADFPFETTFETMISPSSTTLTFSFGTGRLAFQVTPWADIYIGPRKIGTTPLAARSLYQGIYSVRLVNSDLGVDRTVPVRIQARETTVLKVDLQQ